MFDTLPSDPRDAALSAAQCVFFDHGHRLAVAARSIGGPSAEAQVIDLGVRLTHASRMTHRLRRDLGALHRLLALDEVPEADGEHTLVLAGINLASPRIRVHQEWQDQPTKLTRGTASDNLKHLVQGGWLCGYKAVLRGASVRLWSDYPFGLSGSPAFRALGAMPRKPDSFSPFRESWVNSMSVGFSRVMRRNVS
jgi:hypothetical protein